MSKVMSAAEFVSKLIDCANNYTTLYIKGCFGAPMTEKNKKRYTTNTVYNAKPSRKKKIMAATDDTFGFDCVCLPKGILWGWSGDKTKVYGGAAYESNGVPDIGANQIIKVCNEVSEDFSQIDVGELCWMSGHVGIYVGNGLCVECSPKWKDGVQITACNRNVEGYNRRDWKKHGKLPWVEYNKTITVELYVLYKGMKGEQVKTLQRLLLALGYDLKSYGVDGSFGGVTESAVKAFQADRNLQVDGRVGPATWSSLLKG